MTETRDPADRVADAKAELFGRILSMIPGRVRNQAEDWLDDLVTLSEDSVDDTERDVIVTRALDPAPYAWEVASAVRIVQASSAEAAARTALAEVDEEIDGKGYEPDPNPHVWVRPAGDAGPWQRVDL